MAFSSNLSETTIFAKNDKGDAIAYHQYASMAVDVSNAHVSDSGWFTVTRSARDIDTDQRRKFLYSVPLRSTNDLEGMRMPPQELSDNIILRLPSPSGKVIAIFRHEVKDKSVEATKTTVLEVWEEYGSCLRRRIELPKTQHGKVICDVSGGFGIPSWNSDETVLVYVAERIAPLTVSFFDGSSKKEDPPPVVGGQNVFSVGVAEHYGEKYSKQAPLHDLFCVNVATGRIGKVTNVPDGATSGSGGYTFGQPVFCPKANVLDVEDGQNSTSDEEEMIVYTGWDAGNKGVLSRRFGLIYCQQRSCQLYLSKVTHLLQRLSQEEDEDDTALLSEDPAAVSLTPHFRLSHSPRFTPLAAADSSNRRSKLVFLCSVKGFDTHSGCFSLRMMDSSNFDDFFGDHLISEDTIKSFSSEIVGEVWDAPTVSSSETSTVGQVAGLGFPGLFLQQLPSSCFLSPDHLVTTTQWGSCQKVILISLQSPGSVHLLHFEGVHPYSSDELLCCSMYSTDTNAGNGILVSTKTPGSPASLHFISASQLLRDSATWTRNAPIHVSSKVLPMFAPIASSQIASAVAPQDAVDFDIRVMEAPVVSDVECRHDIQSILLLPKASSEVPPPLIVVPHGGPHSASVTSYLPSYAFLCGYGGYAVLLVNYRGSTGFGQASVQSLPQQIGRLDLEDLIAATQSVCASGLMDAQRVGICGGSHGGFLTAHATGQYPEMFAAAVMRNPVVNLASMVTSTDIPDWCYVEALGGPYDWTRYRPPTLEELNAFYRVSPIQYVQNVKLPTLIAIGLKDLRVPSSQGLEWFHSLRSQENQVVQLLSYENDDHAIDGVASEADHWIHIKQWFDQYLRPISSPHT